MHTHTQMNAGKFLEVVDMFSTLIVVMVTWAYSYVQIHHNLCIKIVYQICHNKAYKKEEKRDLKSEAVVISWTEISEKKKQSSSDIYSKSKWCHQEAAVSESTNAKELDYGN